MKRVLEEKSQKFPLKCNNYQSDFSTKKVGTGGTKFFAARKEKRATISRCLYFNLRNHMDEQTLQDMTTVLLLFSLIPGNNLQYPLRVQDNGLIHFYKFP